MLTCSWLKIWSIGDFVITTCMTVCATSHCGIFYDWSWRGCSYDRTGIHGMRSWRLAEHSLVT